MSDDRFTDSFNEHAETLRETREAADFDNLQHTLSDVDVGQQVKHGLRKKDVDPITGQKKDEIAEAVWRTLEEWLRVPYYRAAHEKLVKAVREAVADADRLLDNIRARLSQAHTDMDELLSKAARLKDGRAVFRFADGRVEDEDGNIIDPALTAHITWTPDMPSGEAYRSQGDRIEQLEAAEREALGIQTELGEIDNRAHDNENPFAPDELPQQAGRVMDLRERLDAIDADVQSANSDNLSSEISGADADVSASLSDLKKLPKINLGAGKKP